MQNILPSSLLSVQQSTVILIHLLHMLRNHEIVFDVLQGECCNIHKFPRRSAVNDDEMNSQFLSQTLAEDTQKQKKNFSSMEESSSCRKWFSGRTRIFFSGSEGLNGVEGKEVFKYFH